jgi:RecA/RadA recombinase
MGKTKSEEEKLDSAIFEALDTINKINPYATYLSDSTISSSVDKWIDTGSYVLNALISGSVNGGIPQGRVTLLAGESKVGKSLFIMKILANAQQDGYIPVIFDSENALDPKGAMRVGLDLAKVKYVPCTTIEQTRNAIYKFLESIQADERLHNKFVVAIDSLGNMQSELELKRMGKDNTASDMGSAARATKSLLKMITNQGGLTGTTFVCTNHVYDDPAAMFPSLEKNMTGGKGTAYLPSVTVQLARKPIDARKAENQSKHGGELATAQKTYAGIIIRALTVKNRFIQQYLEGEMYLSFATGLDRYFGLLELALGVGAVIQTGATYTLEDGTKLGHYKRFRKDVGLWEDTIIPIIEDRIAAEWSYSNGDEAEVAELEEEILNLENE